MNNEYRHSEVTQNAVSVNPVNNLKHFGQNVGFFFIATHSH